MVVSSRTVVRPEDSSMKQMQARAARLGGNVLFVPTYDVTGTGRLPVRIKDNQLKRGVALLALVFAQEKPTSLQKEGVQGGSRLSA